MDVVKLIRCTVNCLHLPGSGELTDVSRTSDEESESVGYARKR